MSQIDRDIERRLSAQRMIAQGGSTRPSKPGQPAFAQSSNTAAAVSNGAKGAAASGNVRATKPGQPAFAQSNVRSPKPPLVSSPSNTGVGGSVGSVVGRPETGPQANKRDRLRAMIVAFNKQHPNQALPIPDAYEPGMFERISQRAGELAASGVVSANSGLMQIQQALGEFANEAATRSAVAIAGAGEQARAAADTAGMVGNIFKSEAERASFRAALAAAGSGANAAASAANAAQTASNVGRGVLAGADAVAGDDLRAAGNTAKGAAIGANAIAGDAIQTAGNVARGTGIALGATAEDAALLTRVGLQMGAGQIADNAPTAMAAARMGLRLGLNGIGLNGDSGASANQPAAPQVTPTAAPAQTAVDPTQIEERNRRVMPVRAGAQALAEERDRLQVQINQIRNEMFRASGSPVMKERYRQALGRLNTEHATLDGDLKTMSRFLEAQGREDNPLTDSDRIAFEVSAARAFQHDARRLTRVASEYRASGNEEAAIQAETLAEQRRTQEQEFRANPRMFENNPVNPALRESAQGINGLSNERIAQIADLRRTINGELGREPSDLQLTAEQVAQSTAQTEIARQEQTRRALAGQESTVDASGQPVQPKTPQQMIDEMTAGLQLDRLAVQKAMELEGVTAETEAIGAQQFVSSYNRLRNEKRIDTNNDVADANLILAAVKELDRLKQESPELYKVRQSLYKQGLSGRSDPRNRDQGSIGSAVSEFGDTLKLISTGKFAQAFSDSGANDAQFRSVIDRLVKHLGN